MPRMKLNRRDPVASLGPHGVPPQLEAEFLKHKHLGQVFDDAMAQVPFISRDSLQGKGGRKHHSKDDERYWAQFFDAEKSIDVAGGHGVPLNGMCAELMFGWLGGSAGVTRPEAISPSGCLGS